MPDLTTLCAIVKDELPYLLEWIAYHRLIGFNRIVIYSNDCSDGSDALLNTLAQKGVIEHRPWPSASGQSPQLTAYKDAVSNCSTKWIMFLDVDEFLSLVLDKSIDSFLARFSPSVAGIAVNWRVFGSGGELFQRNQLVIERFTLASIRDHHLNRHCKTIAVACKIEEPHIHRSFLRSGDYVDSSGTNIEIARMGFTSVVLHSICQVNHYILKSRAEFDNKRKRGNANRAPGSIDKYTSRDGDYFTRHDLNDEEDLSMTIFFDPVRSAVNQLRYLIVHDI